MKALGISQAGRPFELNVSMILEDMGWALWQRPQKEREPFEFWPQLWKGAETWYIPVEQLFLSTYIAPFQVEPLIKEQHIMVRTSFLNKRWMENGSPQPTSAKAQLLTLTKQCACLHQRSTLSASPLSLELQVLLGFSSAPTCIPLAASVVCREGRGDIATEWDIPQMSLVRATHACELQSLFSPTLTPSGWKEEWSEAASGLNPEVWLVITQEPRPLDSCADSWVVCRTHVNNVSGLTPSLEDLINQWFRSRVERIITYFGNYYLILFFFLACACRTTK